MPPFIRRRALLLALLFLALWIVLPGAAKAAERPNILLILADDLGYGDISCFNPSSKIATPNVDSLAKQGMRFTDAHAPGAVCIPSRYGLITGQYPFRQNGNPDKGPLIAPDRMTIASLLKSQGYRTAMIGKWHLGFKGGIHFNYEAPLRGGPVDHGFDTFFGMHASLDIPPYFYITNDHPVTVPTVKVRASSSDDWSPIQSAFWREGLMAADFHHEDVLPTWTRKAEEFLAAQKTQQPFFLYLAITAPHTPWLPAPAFRGKSGAGMYGDYVEQVDAAIGQVLTSLEKSGQRENTLVIFTSDNGPVWFPADVTKYGHSASSIYRGMKGDAWEGGHRMPFIVRWPGKVKPGSVTAQPVCFTDFLATFADVLGHPLPEGAGKDSFSFLGPLLGSKRGPVRDYLAIQSSRGVVTIRQGDWKLIPELGSGGFTKPSKENPVPGGPTGQLYDLAHDPGETNNLYLAEPDHVRVLSELLGKVKGEGRGR